MGSYRFIDKDPIIDVIRTAMQQLGWNQERLAKESGITNWTIHHWLEGETKRPQNATIDLALRVMGIDRRPRWHSGALVSETYQMYSRPEVTPPVQTNVVPIKQPRKAWGSKADIEAALVKPTRAAQAG